MGWHVSLLEKSGRFCFCVANNNFQICCFMCLVLQYRGIIIKSLMQHWFGMRRLWMARIKVKHVTHPQHHNIEDIYVFRKVNILVYWRFLNKNISTDLLGFLIFRIVVKNRPADPKKTKPMFPRFANKSLLWHGIIWIAMRCHEMRWNIMKNDWWGGRWTLRTPADTPSHIFLIFRIKCTPLDQGCITPIN